MDSQDQTFTGIWHCTHWYPSSDDSAEDVTENEMRVSQDGREFVFESSPNTEGSYMFVRLSVDGDVATGTWYETTSPQGDFKSATYSGAGQLLLDNDNKHMAGLWAGVGYDHAQNKQRVYTGKWELRYVGEQPADA